MDDETYKYNLDYWLRYLWAGINPVDYSPLIGWHVDMVGISYDTVEAD